MPDPAPPPPSGTNPSPPPAGGFSLVIPEEVAQQFGALLELIKTSESMNDEERQYWINILPIMTPEQVKNLQDILENEKKQLAAIDEKYAKEMQKIEQTESVRKTEDERKKKRETRSTAEASHKQEEEKETEDLLKKIEGEA